MRHFNKIIHSISPAAWLAIALTLAMLVPNIWLAATTEVPPLVNISNIIFPAGLYLFCASLFRRNTFLWPCWLCICIWCAFQIVLIFLYGGGAPIGVDMLLNVVTTNMSEATELLANLGLAIALVIILYLPPLIAGAIQFFKKAMLTKREHRAFVYTALGLIITGLTCLGIESARMGDNYIDLLSEEIFPVNVHHNVIEAVERTHEVAEYPQTSADFRYGSTIDHRRRNHPQICVMVVGETSRTPNWQLGGYPRPTNPKLSQRQGVVFFPRAFSESNTTHKSVPMLISPISSPTFVHINKVKSIITAYREAGFNTAFISNQAPNHSYTEYFGNEADQTVYLTNTSDHHSYDTETLPVLKEFITANHEGNLFVLIHSYGSHYKYSERYPAEQKYFEPDKCNEADAHNREILVNAYDNTIRQTDLFLDSIASILESDGRPSSMVYAADHGEDIFDDSRNRFLHASPTPTYYQLHVAMLTWTSRSYDRLYPSRNVTMQANAHRPVSSTQSLFHTSLDLAGISTQYFKQGKSVASTLYNDHPAHQPNYLTDLNRSVPLSRAGIKKEDRAKFVLLGIDAE